MNRRSALRTLAAAGCAAALAPHALRAAEPQLRAIASSGERIPSIGLGTWLTFDVGPGEARQARGEILRAFLQAGGRLVDSSPMYGDAEATIGAEYARIGREGAIFAATKVWTVGELAGRRQIEKSRSLWGVARFDLLQVHNLLDWQTQLATLKAMKAEGRVRYIGITTSHGRRHDLVEDLLRRERLDFVQVTYSLADREVESRLLGLAMDRGTAVVANRPFDGGAMFQRVRGKPLPGWSREIGCATWAAAFLKFIVSHGALTCAIPATSQLAHLRENMAALGGPLPDAALRRRMAADFERLR